MLSTLRDAWKIPDIRKKILFTLAMMFVIRFGSAIPVPYMNTEAIAQLFAQTENSLLSFIDLMSGGNFSSFSVFAANIYPYITASIVIQLLTFAIPALEDLSKEGPEGQRKIQNLTKYLAIILAFVTAFGYTFGVFREAIETTNMLENVVVIFSIVGGTSFLIWLSNVITKYGIGNGTSLIIFIGIVSQLPQQVFSLYRGVSTGYLNIIPVMLFTIFALITVVVVVALNEGERRVPVQYAKRVVGRKLYGGQSTHIPIKVNMAGVMPVIFANAILTIPGMFALINPDSGIAQFFANWFTVQTTRGTIVYSILNVVLIIAFAFFYTTMQFNTVEYSKNLQQNGGFIPGIRPGRPTSEYLTRVVNRLVIVGAVILAFLALTPTLIGTFTKLPVLFGGTSIIIVVGVVIDTVKAIEQQLLLRNYSGFLD